MLWLFSLLVLAFVLLYVWIIRPILKQQPMLSAAFAAEAADRRSRDVGGLADGALVRRPQAAEGRADHQAALIARRGLMKKMDDADVRQVVAEVLAEQKRLHNSEVDEVVLRTISTILTSFGIEEEDRAEMRADFIHLRKW